MRTRVGSALVSAGLLAIALALAHDLTFLARYGSRYGEALAHGGHGSAWSAAVATTVALGALLALVACARIVRLAVQVRRRGEARAVRDRRFLRDGPARRPVRAPSLARLWLTVGPRTAALTTVALTIQENLERAATGQAWTGPTILLRPEYAGGIWIAVAVGLAVGLVAALLRWRVEVLRARLRALANPQTTPAATETPRPVLIPRRLKASLLGRCSGLRAPPFAPAS